MLIDTIIELFEKWNILKQKSNFKTKPEIVSSPQNEEEPRRDSI